MSTTCPDRRSRGFAIASAIFILVVLSALAGFIVSISSSQQLDFAADVQGARAYQAARAGTEWAIFQWLSATPSVTCPSTVPGSPLTFPDPDLSGFQSVVVGTLSADGNFCAILATASPTGSVSGSLGYVERQIKVLAEGN